MSQTQAKRIVLVAVVASAALASVRPLRDGHAPDVRIAVGAVILAVILLTLAEVTPQLAGSFGLLVLVSALFATGPETWNTLTGATKGKTK